MDRIIPIKGLRDTNKVAEMCANLPEPVYVTRNVYGEMLIMSMEAYESGIARINAYSKILAGKNQADNGMLEDGNAILIKSGEKYGLL